MSAGSPGIKITERQRQRTRLLVVLEAPMAGQPIPAQPTATFSNAPTPCRMGSVVGPNIPQEVGHWAASTLTPPSYPFSVTEVRMT